MSPLLHTHDLIRRSLLGVVSLSSLSCLCSLFLFSFFFYAEEEPAQSHTTCYIYSTFFLSKCFRFVTASNCRLLLLFAKQREREREDGQTQAALAERDAIEN